MKQHFGVVSLFSGVGGFDVGFEQAGFTTVFQCEIDKHASSVLRRHFPHVDRWDDITTLSGEHIMQCLDAKNLTPDVVIWGSPCQDLSIAGNGQGLAGSRSGLFFEGIRVINEIRKATHGKYPRISVWENVAGALASNKGDDFEKVIETLAESGSLVTEWRVLDAQFFGIPHRRRRVFVISLFDSYSAERSTPTILPFTRRMRRHTAKSSTQEQSAAASFDASTHTTSESTNVEDVQTVLAFDTQFGRNAGVFSDVAPTLKASQVPPTVQQSRAVLMREREGKAGGGKGLLLSPETSLSLLAHNDQQLWIDSGEHSVLRKLTPLECERLMGWEDDWTKYTETGQEQSDAQRCKQCGNGVAAPVARWIAEHLRVLL